MIPKKYDDDDDDDRRETSVILAERSLKHFSYPFETRFGYNIHSMTLKGWFRHGTRPFTGQVSCRYEPTRMLVRYWNRYAYKVKDGVFFND